MVPKTGVFQAALTGSYIESTSITVAFCPGGFLSGILC